MQVLEVLDIMKIGKNTAVTINSDGTGLKNGVGILDDRGVPHIVSSVGIGRIKPEYIQENMSVLTLLVDGEFESKKIFL